MINITDILAWIKPSPKYLIPVGIVTALLLFSPSSFLIELGFVGFVESYGLWIALIFLLVWAMLLTLIGYWIVESIVRNIKNKRIIRERIKRLKSLSPEEKLALSDFIIDETKSKEFPLGNGVASSLAAAEIIYQASVYSNGMNLIYNIQPWAWKELNKDLAHLEPEFGIRREMKNQ